MNFYGRYLQALLTFLNKNLHKGGVSAVFLAQLSKSHVLLYISLQRATLKALSVVTNRTCTILNNAKK
ncbi:MAG TPA: hypothetical protein DDW51_23795 [Cyanobacteria bacterium UBA11367]|nr:hypothetical protein [Cyanobacteria bacterium UBA11367]HBE57859.1 hypothetical protein [Cyanobacteria bacterium UBA11366]HBK61968.1 hypothetical protein [Cyanobacteria bacterium UBA11166]HBS67660.1 hypothetical protein [Cyanobacteria bacterium UBA11153]